MELNFWKPSPEIANDQPSATLAAGPSRAGSAKAGIYQNVVLWLAYATAFLLPLFFLPWTSSLLELNKQTLLLALAGVGLVVWLLGVVVSGQMTLRSFGSVDRGVLALWVAALAATIFSLSKYRSLFGINVSLSESLATLSALSIFYFLATNTMTDRGRALRALLSVSALLALAFGLLQMLNVHLLGTVFANSRAFNTVGSINTLGVLAAIMLPLFSKLRFDFDKYNVIRVLGVLLSLALLGLLNWWVLWAIAVAGMLVSVAMDSLAVPAGGRGTARGLKMSQFLLPMVVIIFGVFLLIIKFDLTSVKKNFPVEIAPSHGLSYSISKSVLKERLVYGYGPENFSIAFDRYGASSIANSSLATLKFFDGTSQVANFIIAGGLLMALALLYFLWTLIEAVIWSQKSDDYDAGNLSGTLSALGAMVAAMFLYPFNTTLMFMLYAVLGLLVLQLWGGSRRTVNIEEKPAFSLASSLGFILGLILVLAGSYFGGVRYIADTAYARALAETDINKTVSLLVKAYGLNGQDDRYYRAGSQAALALLKTELSKKQEPGDTQRNARIEGYVNSALTLAQKATTVEPRETNNWVNLGNIYESLLGLAGGADQLAENAYAKAAELRPGDATFANMSGTLYLTKSDLARQLAASAGANASKFTKEAETSLAKAEKYFKQAVDISPNYGLAIYNLAAVYDRQGKVADATKQLEKIIPANANQPNLLFELGLLYYRAGRKDDAFAALQKAVYLSPSYANARWYLALIYEERRDLPAAIEQLNRILETNKNNQTVLNKRSQLLNGQSNIPPASVIDQKPL